MAKRSAKVQGDVLARVALLNLTWLDTMASGNSSTSQAHFLQMVSQTWLRILWALFHCFTRENQDEEDFNKNVLLVAAETEEQAPGIA